MKKYIFRFIVVGILYTYSNNNFNDWNHEYDENIIGEKINGYKYTCYNYLK